MERDFQTVLHDATQLPESERAALAGLLLESLEPDSDPDVEAAWSEEIKRRMAEVRNGSVQLVPWEEVKARLHAIVDER